MKMGSVNNIMNSIENTVYTTIIVVADDVTGAADSAARCCNAGLEAVIDLATTADATLPHTAKHAVTLALSTDSRFLPPAMAAERVTQLLTPLVRAQPDRTTGEHATRWYKKIDSTLRGNIGSELAAMLPLVTPPHQRPCAIISPAFPAQKRTLVDGYLCYAGLPPRSVHLPSLLAEQCDLTVATIPLALVRGPRTQLEEHVLAAYQAGSTLFVIDAESETDLQRLLMAVTVTIPHALLCGSAGLVGVLAEVLVTAQTQQPSSTDDQFTVDTSKASNTTTVVKHPILAVVGSGSTMAQNQLAFLRTQGQVELFTVEPEQPHTQQRLLTSIRSGRQLPTAEPPSPLIERTDGPSSATDIVLCLPMPALDTHLEGAVARRYATALAATAQALLPIVNPATLLLVGGDTAVQTLTMLDIRRLHVIQELLPGMPLATAQDHQGKEYQIILKAGNHGDETTLAYLLQR